MQAPHYSSLLIGLSAVLLHLFFSSLPSWASEPEPFQVARSALNREIPIYSIGEGEATALIIGVIHGDEPQGGPMIRRLMGELVRLEANLGDRRVIALPVLNPDGLALGTRSNGRGVDLNRNFPTADWGMGEGGRFWGGPEPASESETRLCVELIHTYRPARILAIHSAYRLINPDGPEPAMRLARAMQELNRYPVVADIGYPTPGSLGTYSGRELRIPTITLEVPQVGAELAWKENRRALLRFVMEENREGGDETAS